MGFKPKESNLFSNEQENSGRLFSLMLLTLQSIRHLELFVTFHRKCESWGEKTSLKKKSYCYESTGFFLEKQVKQQIFLPFFCVKNQVSSIWLNLAHPYYKWLGMCANLLRIIMNWSRSPEQSRNRLVFGLSCLRLCLFVLLKVRKLCSVSIWSHQPPTPSLLYIPNLLRSLR